MAPKTAKLELYKQLVCLASAFKSSAGLHKWLRSCTSAQGGRILVQNGQNWLRFA